MDFLFVFFLTEQVRFSEVGSDDKAKDVDFFSLVVVAY